MRAGWVWAAVILALLPQVSAAEPFVTLLDWQDRQSAIGTTPLVLSPVAERFPFETDACHRNLLLDLLYDPDETGADVDRVGAVFIDHDFLVEVRSDDSLVQQSRIRHSGYGHRVGTLPQDGPYELRVSLANGALVSWQARLRGAAVFGELACEPPVIVTEIEANPAGPDAGTEWVELYNAGDEGADLSLWTLTPTQGAPLSLTLPSGTWLAPGERLVVMFPDGPALDDVDSSLVLRDAFGRGRDATAVRSDEEDDHRSWQRDPRGPIGWSFADATPGA